MSEQIEAKAYVEFLLPQPVSVRRNYEETHLEADRLRFESIQTGPNARTASFTYVEARLFDADGNNAEVSKCWDGRWSPPLPDWCPKPPEGWDAHVRAFREQVEAEAVAK